MRTGLRQVRAVLFSAGALLAMGATAFAEAPAIDLCKFLTQAEVESVMGKKLTGAPVSRKSDDWGNRWCEYPGTDIHVEVEAFNNLRYRYKGDGEDESVSVPGLGGEAWMSRGIRGGYVSLAMRKGYAPINRFTNHTPGVGLVMSMHPGAEEKIKELGKKVIGRM